DDVKKAPEAADKAASDVIEKATDAVNKAVDDVKKAPEAADKAASDVIEKATDAVNKAVDDVKKAPEAADKAASDVIEKATDAVNKAVDDVKKAPEAADKAASSAAEKATDAVNKAVDAVKEAPEAADKAASSAVEKATDAVDKAVDAVKEAPEAADKAASSAVEKATDAVNKAIDAVKEAPEAADKAASSAVEKATDAVNKAVDAVKEAPEAADKAASSAVEKATDAVDKAIDAVKEAPEAADKAASSAMEKATSVAEHQGIILENQQALFKDYDLDKLLHKIRMVLEHNSLKNVNKQFHELFDTEASSVYSCSFEKSAVDEKSQTVKEEIEQDHSTGDQTKVAAVEAKVESHDHENSQPFNKAHEVSAPIEAHQSDNLSSSKALYKEGYDFIRSANYVDAEKSFCAFQNRYKKDSLSDDALFWLAESLLGQKRYHEAAQVYLTAWYADKKKLYTSEILLKLARSMVALEPNKDDCAHFVKKSKRQQTLASVFCKPAK
ncbi:tol-pal system protein, partial [Bartonella sp. CL2QHWL]